MARWVTDAWQAYEACLPAEQRQVGKPAMQRLERKQLTLRTRLKRLARKTICFSKKQFFHGRLDYLIYLPLLLLTIYGLNTRPKIEGAVIINLVEPPRRVGNA